MKMRISALLLISALLISSLLSCDKPMENDPPLESDAEVTKSAELTTNTETTAARTPTKFELQFSAENEQLLSELIGDVKSGDVLDDIPDKLKEGATRERAGDGAYTFIYSEADDTLYRTLCESLREGGFAQYTEREFNGEETSAVNLFATFISNVTQVDIGYHKYSSRIYVTATPRIASVLPQREAPEYTAAGEEYPTIMTQYGLEDFNHDESSMGYIIRLADGSFVIIDGGESYEGIQRRIYNILLKQAPDPDHIVISAWILTHAHIDHVGAFIRFAETYGSSAKVTLKQVVYNFPDDTNISSDLVSLQNEVRAAAAHFGKDVETLKAHTGNVLYYADVSFNVLYTQEEHLATGAYFENYNSSSLVTQMVTSDGTKVFIAADQPVLSPNGCERAVYRWYGSFIESYVSTTFHHGYGGGADTRVYYEIGPKIILWCVEEYRVELNGLKTFEHNLYFTGNGAKATYYIAGKKVQILSFSEGKATVVEYDSFAKYWAS